MQVRKQGGELKGKPQHIEDDPKRVAAMRRLHKRQHVVDDNDLLAFSGGHILLELEKVNPSGWMLIRHWLSGERRFTPVSSSRGKRRCRTKAPSEIY